jgi:hypothetical protein
MRTYGEVIDVRTVPATGSALGVRAQAVGGADGGADAGSGVPAQFLWRGRVYLVRDVLAHWVELGAWWVAPGRSRRSAGPAGSAGSAGSTAELPRSVAVDVGAVEREVWRVEAAAGRSAATGVYDLVRDVPAAHRSGGPTYAADLGPDDPSAPGMRPGGHRPDVPPRWRLARALD